MKRILVYHNASLGDAIVALPALKLIRKTFKESTIFLLTVEHHNIKATQAEKILVNTNLIDGYILLKDNYKTISRLIKLRNDIRTFRPDCLVYLNEPRNQFKLIRDYLMFKFFGIKEIIGINFSKSGRELEKIEDGQYENISHFLGRKISNLGSIDFSDPSNFALNLTSEEHSKANQILAQITKSQPIISISIGTKFASNHWGDDLWEKFLSLLASKYPNHYLISIGSSDEFDRTENLLRSWKNRSLNLCGALSIRESAAVISQCVVFVGHDSGPIHLASSVETPCVGIYGSRNLPGIWFPAGKTNQIIYTKIECQGCQLVVCSDKNNECIRAITPSRVLAAVENFLSPST
jgi:ADP-heptose:LPS heptosyltransferase